VRKTEYLEQATKNKEVKSHCEGEVKLGLGGVSAELFRWLVHDCRSLGGELHLQQHFLNVNRQQQASAATATVVVNSIVDVILTDLTEQTSVSVALTTVWVLQVPSRRAATGRIAESRRT